MPKGENPESRKNLNPFKPGAEWRGNPGGMPRKPLLTDAIRRILEKTEINGQPIKDSRQIADLVAETLVKAGLKGNTKAIEMLLDRMDGKVMQPIDITSADKPLETLTGVSEGDVDEWAKKRAKRVAEKAVTPNGHVPHEPDTQASKLPRRLQGKSMRAKDIIPEEPPPESSNGNGKKPKT
jgi:hypothetical protein